MKKIIGLLIFFCLLAAMTYKPGGSYVAEFVTSTPSTGAAVNADSLPTATAMHNGTDDGTFTLTVTNMDTGRYMVTGTVPAYSAGDVVQVSVAATVAGIAGKAVIDNFQIDSSFPSDTYAQVTNGTYGLSAINTAMCKDSTVAKASSVTALGSPMQAGTAVTLATSQPNYAPAKAGDAMTLAASQHVIVDSGTVTATNMIADPAASIAALGSPLQTTDVRLNNLDASISSRLASSGYTAPDNASITLIRAQTDKIIFDGSNFVKAVAQNSLVALPALQGQVYTAVATQSKDVSIVRGDTPRITFDLGADYTGWTPRFGAKASPVDTSYVIAVKNATWTDASKGQGYVDLTATDTAASGKLFGEIELVNGTQHLTAIKFNLKIVEDVIK